MGDEPTAGSQSLKGLGVGQAAQSPMESGGGHDKKPEVFRFQKRVQCQNKENNVSRLLCLGLESALKGATPTPSPGSFPHILPGI